MGYVMAVVLALAVAIYVVMHFWWIALVALLGWVGWRLVRDELTARQALRVAAAGEIAALRQRADDGHAAYMRRELTF
jgi:hypothetical protein